MTHLSHCHPDATHKPGDCHLCDHYEAERRNKRTFPHCDAYVVHSPGVCEYCDDYAADLQKWREANGVNFTDKNDPSNMPCPAVTRRDPHKIHRWYGNAPQPKTCPICKKPPQWVQLALACPDHGPF